MDILLRFMLILGICLYFIILIYLIKNQHLNLKYTLVWFSLGLILIIITVFPNLVSLISILLGIHSDVNSVFLLLFFCILIIMMQLTAIISRYNLKVRKMVQKQALTEYKIRRFLDKMN